MTKAGLYGDGLRLWQNASSDFAGLCGKIPLVCADEEALPLGPEEAREKPTSYMCRSFFSRLASPCELP